MMHLTIDMSWELKQFFSYDLPWLAATFGCGLVLYFVITALYKDGKEFSNAVLWFIVAMMTAIIVFTPFAWTYGNSRCWFKYLIGISATVVASYFFHKYEMERLNKAIILSTVFLLIFASIFVGKTTSYYPWIFGVLQGSSIYFFKSSFLKYLKLKQKGNSPHQE